MTCKLFNSTTLLFCIALFINSFHSFGQTQEGVQSFFKYDKNGYLIRKIVIDHSDSSTDTIFYEYNSKGQLLHEKKGAVTKSYQYNSIGKQKLLTSFNASTNKMDTLNIRGYDSKGRLKFEKRFSFILSWSVYDYAENEKTISFLNFQDSSIYSKRKYFYDENKKLRKSYHFQKNSILSDSTLYFYNEQDSLIQSITYPEQTSTQVEWEITSDQILKTTNYYSSENGSLIQTEIKVFIYNDEKQLIEKKEIDNYYFLFE